MIYFDIKSQNYYNVHKIKSIFVGNFKLQY